MLFYEKTQDIEDIPYNNYEVLCGIEEEFFIISTLEVQGLKIPLQEDDRILNTLSQTDYLTRRLFGGLGF